VTREQIDGLPAFVHPCPGSTVSSRFGWRSFDNAFHLGLDLAAPTGTPILAAVGGTVIIADSNPSAGNWVVISHGGGLVTKYMHASELLVSAGDTVSAGDVIATVGNTGNSFGAHLHFQVEIGGTAVDPQLFV
jgi:murein DD-endopeptidase MepM/ murein hydrolase activator NlpD